MANFKNKILNTLKNEKQSNNTLKYLSEIQKNIIKNHSKPVFSENDKTKLLDKYSKIDTLGKALYKHNVLKQNDINYENEEENVSNLVLKCGISSCKYVWHSENSENTCEACSSLDGTEYGFEDEVPERPHPNCQCWVEIIENFDDSEYEEDICEGFYEIEQNLQDAEEASNQAEGIHDTLVEYEQDITSSIQEIQALSQEVEKERAELIEMAENATDELKFSFSDLYTPIEIAIIIEHGQEVLYIVEEAYECWQIFNDYKSKLDELKAAGLCTECTDKFYHANANYDCTKRGEVGEFTAVILSIFKEIADLFEKVILKKKDFLIVWKDCMNDLKADWYGIQKAKEQINSEKNLKMSEIKDIFKPKK